MCLLDRQQKLTGWNDGGPVRVLLLEIERTAVRWTAEDE